MTICVNEVKYNVINTKTRMPFKFGIVSMTKAPHLFVTAEMEVDGIKIEGISSEGLLPKWFTKDPEKSYKEEINEMLTVIKKACDLAVETAERESVFDLWYEIYTKQKEWGDRLRVPGLLRSFGVSMIERAIIDGYCKAKKVTVRDALKNNSLRIELGKIYSELDSIEPVDLNSFDGVEEMFVRHTIGLSDFLRTSEINSDERVSDGLPQAFEECIMTYGLERFKIKISGDINKDVKRLTEIATILYENKIYDYGFTLDGNENFEDAEDFVNLWENLRKETTLEELLSHLIFVEQPIKRTTALSEETKKVFTNWKNKPPMIIDESDSEIGSVILALECGYMGTSHKNCKGIIKGIANACLLKHREMDSGVKFILSGEDLANIGPVALLQDLVVSSLLGIDHIERNGHHYFKGLSMFPKSVQKSILSAHSDLYRLHEEGFATLNIIRGRINIDSLLNAPFGFNFDLELDKFTLLDEWKYETLDD